MHGHRLPCVWGSCGDGSTELDRWRGYVYGSKCSQVLESATKHQVDTRWLEAFVLRREALQVLLQLVRSEWVEGEERRAVRTFESHSEGAVPQWIAARNNTCWRARLLGGGNRRQTGKDRPAVQTMFSLGVFKFFAGKTSATTRGLTSGVRLLSGRICLRHRGNTIAGCNDKEAVAKSGVRGIRRRVLELEMCTLSVQE